MDIDILVILAMSIDVKPTKIQESVKVVSLNVPQRNFGFMQSLKKNYTSELIKCMYL
jgi:hypothetical protein